MAASKKSLAKSQQKYKPRPVWPECRNCGHYDPKTVEKKMGSLVSWKEDLPVCTLGGFRVKKTGTCDKHEPKANF